MKFTKLKNKLNAFKCEIKRNKAVSYSEWLNAEGLDDNVENRQLYGLYVLSIDESNKKADMRLSQIIGRGVFVAVFLVIFLIMCCNSVDAVGVASNNDFADGYYTTNVDISTVSIPYDYSDGTYNIQYLYFYMGDLSGDLFIIDNQLNFYYDILPLYNDIGSNLNDSEIYYYWTIKYPNADLNVFHWLLGGNSTYFSDIFYSVKSDFYNIENISYNNGYDVGFGDGYDDGESAGFQTGYDDGYDVGLADGYNEGVTDGYDDGYDVGYTNGINDGEIAKKSIFAIFDAPIKVLTSLLDFDIFGINLLSTFKVILTILLLGAIAKFVLSIAL